MLRFETILCPVDFSAYSGLALEYAVQLAKQYSARLIVCHSIVASFGVPVFPDRLQGALPRMEEKNHVLDRFLAARIPEGMEVEQQVLFMSPANGILKVAEDRNVDLIVMGTHGNTGYEAVLMGSVTHKVLHKCNVPVFVVCKPEHGFAEAPGRTGVLLSNILCAVAPGSQIGVKTVHLALTLARSYQAALKFLQVRESVEQDPNLAELKELIQPEKEEWCRSIEFLLERGDPVEEITKAANLYKADLLVLGHHSRRSGALEALGSVALRVISRSPAPVLVSRD